MIWWSEQWMGTPDPHYAASSNVDNAWWLRGDLLLLIDEVDQNVPSAANLQVADALIDEGKTFDLVFMLGRWHTSGSDYGQQHRFGFFANNLLDVKSPDWKDEETTAAVAFSWNNASQAGR